MDYDAHIKVLERDLKVVSDPDAIKLIKEKILFWKQEKAWENQDHQCSGSGYAHKPHGKCSGYTYDRT